MSNYSSVRLRKETIELLNASRGGVSMECYVRSLVGAGPVIGTESGPVEAVGCRFEAAKIDEIIALLRERHVPVPGKPATSSRQKSVETVLLEYDAWCGSYLSSFRGRANDYTREHLLKVREFLESLGLGVSGSC